jgi:hypothetical protein
MTTVVAGAIIMAAANARRDGAADQGRRPPHRDRYGPRWSPGGWCAYCPGYYYSPLIGGACADCRAIWDKYPATRPSGWAPDRSAS